VLEWLFPRPSRVAVEIAEQFRVGPIKTSDLDPHGISELGVEYLGETVTVSWYHRASVFPRDITVNGRRNFGGGVDGRTILRAAKERAARLFEDEARRLERRRVDATT
jgi:hypothetical protein